MCSSHQILYNLDHIFMVLAVLFIITNNTITKLIADIWELFNITGKRSETIRASDFKQTVRLAKFNNKVLPELSKSHFLLQLLTVLAVVGIFYFTNRDYSRLFSVCTLFDPQIKKLSSSDKLFTTCQLVWPQSSAVTALLSELLEENTTSCSNSIETQT